MVARGGWENNKLFVFVEVGRDSAKHYKDDFYAKGRELDLQGFGKTVQGGFGSVVHSWRRVR